MEIKINSEQELIKVAEEAIRVISNLRKFTKLWEESYGVELKERKKRWEARADKFINELQAFELKTNECIKIEINENTP
jgi:hypothetical protein